MKLKSSTDNPVQVALLSGHCIVVGSEGREVPQMFLTEAFKMGCIPTGVDPEEIKEKEPVITSKENKELIVAGIKKMLEDGCTLTGAGLPNRKQLSDAVGFKVSAVDLGEAWQVIEAELA